LRDFSAFRLLGPSVGSHPVEICYGPLCPPFQYRPQLDVFNAAQSAAMIADLVDHELDYLIGQVKGNANINMKQDWKLLNIMIGANDLCASCVYPEHKKLSPDEYETHMRAILEKVRLNIPRTFVNLIQLFNLSQVYTLSLQSPTCKTIHRTLFVECDCLFQPDANGAKTRQEMDDYVQGYNQRIIAIAKSYYGKYPEFAAVAQVFGSNTNLTGMPLGMLSSLDCFHPSLFAHQHMAIALWNNMFTPYANKKTYLDLGDKPMCLTNATLIYTN